MYYLIQDRKTWGFQIWIIQIQIKLFEQLAPGNIKVYANAIQINGNP